MSAGPPPARSLAEEPASRSAISTVIVRRRPPRWSRPTEARRSASGVTSASRRISGTCGTDAWNGSVGSTWSSITSACPATVFLPGNEPNGAYHAGDWYLYTVAVGFPAPPATDDEAALQAQEIAEVTSFGRRREPAALNTPIWPQFNSSPTIMSLAPGGDSQVLPADLIETIHHCGFWDKAARANRRWRQLKRSGRPLEAPTRHPASALRATITVRLLDRELTRSTGLRHASPRRTTTRERSR